MKAKVDGVSKNAQKPMEQFSVEEVQNWFETFQGGIFKNYSAKFQNLNGYLMVKLSKETFQKELGNILGESLYNEWHPKVTGIFFPHLCRFFFVSYFLVLYEPFLLVQLSVFML
jgi:hypothetical protein